MKQTNIDRNTYQPASLTVPLSGGIQDGLTTQGRTLDALLVIGVCMNADAGESG
jgi:hypothetical protein